MFARNEPIEIQGGLAFQPRIHRPTPRLPTHTSNPASKAWQKTQLTRPTHLHREYQPSRVQSNHPTHLVAPSIDGPLLLGQRCLQGRTGGSHELLGGRRAGRHLAGHLLALAIGLPRKQQITKKRRRADEKKKTRASLFGLPIKKQTKVSSQKQNEKKV